MRSWNWSHWSKTVSVDTAWMMAAEVRLRYITYARPNALTIRSPLGPRFAPPLGTYSLVLWARGSGAPPYSMLV